MQPDNQALLAAGLRQLAGAQGARAAESPVVLERIGRHLAEVADWNQRVNLTAITAEREMVIKHALDSATLLGAVRVAPGMRVLDVGSGAGFPGLVIKLLEPGVRVVLLESLQKRCRFLEHVRDQLGIPAPELEVAWGRAEDLGASPGYREQFDLVTARAVAELRILLEYTLPFCRVGGTFVAMKGPGVEGELAVAAQALRELGGEVVQVHRVELPDGTGERNLVVVAKRRSTPRPYPRKAGTPERKPL